MKKNPLSPKKLQKSAVALCLALLLCAVLTACGSSGEGAIALQRAGRTDAKPGYISFQLTMSAGSLEQSGREYILQGELTEDTEDRLTLLHTDVISGGVLQQTVDIYLQRGEYQPVVYRNVDEKWTAQRVSRSYANNWLNSVSYDLTLDLLKDMKSPAIGNSDSTINGVACQQISGTLESGDISNWLNDSLFPSFFGFSSSDSTLYDDVGDITVTAHIGRSDYRIYRLTLNLTPALAPLIERSSNTHQENELWADLRLTACQLQIDYHDYNAPRSLTLPAAALEVDPT